MPFIKRTGKAVEYAGESFTKSLARKDGSVWEATESGVWELVDDASNQVASGVLTKSADNLTLTAQIPKTDTVGLGGNYLLLLSITDSDDADFEDVIAEYFIEYRERKAF